MTAQTDQTSVYSVSNHFRSAHRNQFSKNKSVQKAAATSEKASELADITHSENQQSRGEKYGTSKRLEDEPVVREIKYQAVSPVKEVVDESESEQLKKSEPPFSQNAGQTGAFSDNAEQTKATSALNTFNEEEMQLVTVLTETIQTLGDKFEHMGASFEAKLQTIEERHKELEVKLAETAKLA